jgi:hypothetical protein
MNAFTAFHTALSVLPVGFGLAALARDRAITPDTRLGKWYIGTMLVASVSGLGFIPTLGFTPGQVLGLFTLALIAVGTLTLRGHWRNPGYVQTLALSASYFMLMVFATTETLKHFPTDHPFASGPADPSLIPVRLVLLALFGAGATYQALRIHAENRVVARLERLTADFRHAG